MSRIKKLPDGWKRTALDSICDLQAGKFVPASEILATCNGSSYPCYGGNGLRGFVKDYSHSGTFPLIGRQGALCGNINKASGKFYATEHAVVATPNTNIEVEWLYYQLIHANLNKYATGAAQPGLSVKNIKEIPFVVPPLPEQKAIADQLSTWDEAIEKTERLIQAKEKRFKWLLRELISEPRNTQKDAKWKKVKLGEVCKLYQPQTISKEDMIESGEYKVFGANGVIGFYDQFNHEQSEIAITCRGATCGTINRTEPKSWITGNAMVAQPNEKKILKDYLFYSLLIANMKSVISGAAQPQITRQDLAPLNILVPPLEVQKQIAETLSSAQHEIDLLKQLADKYKTQKRGLMQRLLTGDWRIKPDVVKTFEEKDK